MGDDDPDSNKEPPAKQIPTDMLAQLVSAIDHLARYSCCPSSDSTPLKFENLTSLMGLILESSGFSQCNAS